MSIVKNILKSLPFFKNLDNQFERDDFVVTEIKKIQAGKLLLDAGCGSQRYREH